MADETTIDTILRTKLHRPPAPGDYAHRPRLLEYLDKRRERPLTLVSAPAGYGKSVLISCWLETYDIPNAWLSLDEHDNDLRQFLFYFLAAIKTMFPDAVSETMKLANASPLPPVSVLARSLANELDSIERGFILVLDDIHRIREKSVYDLLMELLRHPPRPMQLVLIGRRDPNLSITSLRAKVQVSEVRLFDLRFTREETAAYLQTVLGEQIDEATASKLAEKAEGWITGLRLAVLAMRGHDDAVRKLLALRGTTVHVTEYMITEVLAAQPPAVQHCLLSTSILNRFCAPLCDALWLPDSERSEGVIDGAAFIAKLQKDNLFLIALDMENRWFRYHHLFRNLLQSQLKQRYSSEEISTIHSRAYEWFAENGFIEEALQHAITAGDIEFALMQIEQHRYTLMNEEKLSRMDRLLQMFPDQVSETHPELLIMKGWISYDANRLQELEEILDHVEPLINAATIENNRARSLLGEMYALLSYKANVKADSKRAMTYLQKAIEMLPPEHTLARGQVAVSYCIARQMSGNQFVIQELEQTLAAGDSAKKSAFHSRKLGGYCFVNWMNGDLVGLMHDADQLLRYTNNWSLQETTLLSCYFLGIACYYRNDIALAEKHLTYVVKNIYLANGIVSIHSCFALALVYHSQGHTQKARDTVEKAATFAKERQSSFNIMWARAFRVEIDLLQGRMDQVQRWADQFNPDLFRALTWFYFPPLTLVKVQLAQGTTESLQQAADLLERLDSFVVSIHNTRFRIDILALQALVLNAQGKEPAAIERFSKSLALAKPGGFIRNFVDLGPPMAGLLKRLYQRNTSADYIVKLLAAFRDDKQVGGPEAAGHFSASAHQPLRPPAPSQSLVEPLTNRELDVLELLAQRLQNKEIAEKLFISPGTVKGHLKNIYQKLTAANRRQAIEKAKKLRIL